MAYNPMSMADQAMMQMMMGGKDPSRPADYVYQGVTTPEGQLQEQYKLKYFTPENLATRRLQEEGLRAPGAESQWAKIALQKQAMEEQKQRGSMQRNLMSQQAQSRANLARGGGLRSGAAERLQMGGQNSMLANLQALRQEGAYNRLNISGQDEQSRQAGLREVSGLEREMTQSNVNQVRMDQKAREAARLEKYKSDMAEWGAGKTADAQRNAGGKK